MSHSKKSFFLLAQTITEVCEQLAAALAGGKADHFLGRTATSWRKRKRYVAAQETSYQEL